MHRVRAVFASRQLRPARGGWQGAPPDPFYRQRPAEDSSAASPRPQSLKVSGDREDSTDVREGPVGAAPRGFRGYVTLGSEPLSAADARGPSGSPLLRAS